MQEPFTPQAWGARFNELRQYFALSFRDVERDYGLNDSTLSRLAKGQYKTTPQNFDLLQIVVNNLEERVRQELADPFDFSKRSTAHAFIFQSLAHSDVSQAILHLNKLAHQIEAILDATEKTVLVVEPGDSFQQHKINHLLTQAAVGIWIGPALYTRPDLPIPMALRTLASDVLELGYRSRKLIGLFGSMTGGLVQLATVIEPHNKAGLDFLAYHLTKLFEKANDYWWVRFRVLQACGIAHVRGIQHDSMTDTIHRIIKTIYISDDVSPTRDLAEWIDGLSKQTVWTPHLLPLQNHADVMRTYNEVAMETWSLQLGEEKLQTWLLHMWHLNLLINFTMRMWNAPEPGVDRNQNLDHIQGHLDQASKIQAVRNAGEWASQVLEVLNIQIRQRYRCGILDIADFRETNLAYFAQLRPSLSGIEQQWWKEVCPRISQGAGPTRIA